jgi:hypothetical protein
MRASDRWRQLPAPIVTAIVLGLLAIAIGFWNQRSESSGETIVAQISRTRAQLADGSDCEFTADVQLAGRWSSFAFSMRREAVRAALVALLREKSSYMVDSRPSREAVRYQMLAAVNGVIGIGRATDLLFTTFELL